MYSVDPLSHTADVGYEVTADSLDELFRGAADGLMRTLGSGPAPGEGDGDGAGEPAGASSRPGAAGTGDADAAGAETGGAERQELSLERPDRERLLVAWLREILYRATRDARHPDEVDVEMTGPLSLRAGIRWSAAGAAEPPVREVKGVTYHGLRVGRDEDGRWHARLVLDV